MNVHHHLDEASLLRYASGNFDTEFAIVVASHLAMCGACRKAVAIAEAVGGEYLGNSEAADLETNAFAKLMARIDDAGSMQAAPKTITLAQDEPVPLPLRRHIGESFDAVAWKTVAPGIQKFDVPLGGKGGASLFMLKIAPGKKVPEHGHGGAEMTLVLSGSYRDDLGRFGPGDIADLDEHVEHQPEVDSAVPCICLVATEAPTRFKGVFSRMMQRFVGI